MIKPFAFVNGLKRNAHVCSAAFLWYRKQVGLQRGFLKQYQSNRWFRLYIGTSAGLWGLLLLRSELRLTVTFVYYASDQPHITFAKGAKLERKKKRVMHCLG